jgi:membrane protease YdiL (CAAX protease family)
LGTLGVAMFAINFTLAMIRNGSTSFLAGVHVANNCAMFLLYPEASNDQATFVDLAGGSPAPIAPRSIRHLGASTASR